MRKLSLSILFASWLSLLTSCSGNQVKEPAIAEPVVEQTEENQLLLSDWSNAVWTNYLGKAIDELGADMMKAEIKDYLEWCPSIEVGRKQFYVMLLSIVARYESGFDPNNFYKEDFKDVKGNYVISRGLLQISPESANGYGCGITNPDMLYDPETNIRCGVRILNRWIQRDGVIQGSMLVREDGKNKTRWLGAGRYWSQFRKEKRIAEIKERLKRVCK